MENKQTALDYLLHNLNPKPITKEEHQEWWDTIAKAKQMEKEQIKDAWLYGQDDGATICTPNQQEPEEKYYNETYGK